MKIRLELGGIFVLCLGLILTNLNGQSTNLADANFQEICLKAQKGDPVAQYNLGAAYLNGNGVEKDYAEAVKWYRKAAKQNYAQAQYSLGVCYYDGEGGEKDYSEAVKWVRKAADQNFANAQFGLG